MSFSDNKQRMLRGDLYHAFTPELMKERTRCFEARNRYNSTSITDHGRRKRVELWRDLVQNKEPMPPVLADEQADEDQFMKTDPWVDYPFYCDYGYNVKLAPGVYINHDATFLDTCEISIGARTLVGPCCQFYSASHPLDPAIRNGTEGPETGKPIWVEEDCWLGGNVTLLPGVRIGKGAVVGAGSVVTKDVPPFHLVAGNPARIIRKIESPWDRGNVAITQPKVSGTDTAEAPMAEEAKKEERVESAVD